MDTFIIVTAHNEADRIEATLRALASAFPGAPVWVADDGSSDDTAGIARRAGALVVRSERTIGKGGAATLAARAVLAKQSRDAATMSGADTTGRGVSIAGATGRGVSIAGATGRGVSIAGATPASSEVCVVLLCDGDLGKSAALLPPLVETVRDRQAELAVAVFARRVGGGLGLTLAFARWAIRRGCGLELRAPISGQRAMSVEVLQHVLPFANGFGMEVGMTIDAAHAGHRVMEVELDLHHRATGRSIQGFIHRGRQLLDCAQAYRVRR